MVPRSASRRRAFGYVFILVCAMFVALVGVGGLLATRSVARSAGVSSEASAARQAALAALQMGITQIASDSTWRTRSAGRWITDMPIAQAKFSLDVSDPVDGDLADDPSDPVVLTGRGACGAARQIVRCRLRARPGRSALELPLIGNDKLRLDHSSCRGGIVVGANATVEGHTASYYADVESGGNVSGDAYYAGVSAPVKQRPMPAPAAAFSYYTTNGTAISITSIPTTAPNLLTNAGVEAGVLPWVAMGTAAITPDSTMYYTGLTSARVAGRTSGNDGIEQDVTALISNGTTYDLGAAVRAVSGTVGRVRVQLTVTSEALLTLLRTTTSYTLSTSDVNTSWRVFSGSVTPIWLGNLVSASVQVCTNSDAASFNVDELWLRESVSSARYMSRVVLSPASNPFAPGSTNAQGIYVIDCGNQTLVIEDCRIVGTLVLLNPKNTTVIRGAMNWRPAVANFPILLTNNDVTIATTRSALNEATLGANFNPVGTPWPYPGGVTNATLSDSFRPVLRGIVYSSAKLKLTGEPTFEGVVMAYDDVEANDARLTLAHLPELLDSPPPGFEPPSWTMELEPGSFERVVE